MLFLKLHAGELENGFGDIMKSPKKLKYIKQKVESEDKLILFQDSVCCLQFLRIMQKTPVRFFIIFYYRNRLKSQKNIQKMIFFNRKISN